MDINLTNNTTLEEVTKQFKVLAIRCHPDRKGGSHEAMAELNTAYNIIKENHNSTLRALSEATNRTQSNEAYRTKMSERQMRDDMMGRSGGLGRNAANAARQMNTHTQQQQARPVRSAKEIEAHWEKYKAETQLKVQRMMNRFEIALDQCIFFKKVSMCNEITARERWLRREFSKGVWEDVHELRQELLKRGSKNLQQSQLAEDMVAFASETQRKLKEDYERQGTYQAQQQMRIQAFRMTYLFFTFGSVISFLVYSVKWFYRHSYVVKFNRAIFGS